MSLPPIAYTADWIDSVSLFIGVHSHSGVCLPKKSMWRRILASAVTVKSLSDLLGFIMRRNTACEAYWALLRNIQKTMSFKMQRAKIDIIGGKTGTHIFELVGRSCINQIKCVNKCKH